MKLSSFSRAVTVLFAASVTLALPLSGASANSKGRGGAALRFPAAAMHITHLSKQQEIALSKRQPANQRVIIIMRNQYLGGSGTSRRMVALRESAVARSQRALLAELRQAHASRVQPFKLINAISAHVSRAEFNYLRSQPSIRAVVPDKRIYLPRPVKAGLPSLRQISRARYAARRALKKCSATKPLLEPEALSQINDASNNPKKLEATSIVNGSGVNVAFMADGFDWHNPDFIRAKTNKTVFTAVHDFSGAGGIFPGGNTEAMLDASSIAAQGNERYWIGQWTNANNPAYNKKSACPIIKVVGAAPGVNLIGLQVFGAFTTTTSFIQAIQWSVDNRVNVLNQSFGGNLYPDQNADPIALADKAAVAAGMVVVVSSGDAGVNNTNGSPSTVPGVIAAGGTTSFQIYKQNGDAAFQLSNGKYKDNGISSLSSGGPTQAGLKSVDVSAPGDLNWSLCDLGDSSCTDNNGFQSGVTEEGGTSESAPLTSSVAALVWQEYRKTHHGRNPSPQTVKEIIMSSATDLHLPSALQGAGLLNALGAVQLAGNWQRPASKHKAEGLSINANGCLTAASNQCNMAMSAAGAPSAAKSFSFSVTNQGKTAEKVTPTSRMLHQTNNTVLNDTFTRTTDATFVDQFGFTRAYQKEHYVVRAGTKVLDAAVSWDNSVAPGALVRLTLLSPNGTYSGYSLPQGSGNGLARVTVHDPAPGNWTYIVWTRANAAGYNGPIQVSSTSYNFASAGTITPSHATVLPGKTAGFTFSTHIPSTAGDGTADVNVVGKANGKVATNMTIPVVLRSMIPTTNTGGTWQGKIMGGNARPDGTNEQTFQFNVPAGANDLSLSIQMADASSQNNIAGVLTGPDGVPADMQSNVTDLDSNGNLVFTNSLQFFRTAPAAGTWTLTLMLAFYSGPSVNEPYTGTIAFNSVVASSSGVPDSAAVVLPQGSGAPASITVTNTGKTTKSYILDSRLNTMTDYTLNGVDSGGLPVGAFTYFVPPKTSRMVVQGLNLTNSSPISLETFNVTGGPNGTAFSPDLYATGPSNYQKIDYSANEVTSGVWQAVVDNLNCPAVCDTSGAESDELIAQADAVTQTFDTDITSDTGDFWQNTAGVNPLFEYTPLILAPGQSGTINLTITPSQPGGTEVSGHIYLDTIQFIPPGCNAASCLFFTTGSGGDQVASFPYDYTVGGTS